MKIIIFITFLILFIGCASKPYKVETRASDFPVHELTSDRSMQEIRQTLDNEPYNGFLMGEGTFEAPYNSSEKMTVLEYYFNKRVWLVFDDTNKLINYGDGLAKDAEFITYKSFYDVLSEKNKILNSAAEKLTYQKYKELYGTTSLEDEYFLYKIMISEKIDNGEINASEAEYLTIKKSNEIKERIRSREYQRSQLSIQSRQLSLARQQLFMQLLQNIKLNNAYSPSYKSVNCSSHKVGNSIYTSCY